MDNTASVARIETALYTVSMLMESDPIYAAIFSRLEFELATARAARDGRTDAQRRAEAYRAAYSAKGTSTL